MHMIKHSTSPVKWQLLIICITPLLPWEQSRWPLQGECRTPVCWRSGFVCPRLADFPPKGLESIFQALGVVGPLWQLLSSAVKSPRAARGSVDLNAELCSSKTRLTKPDLGLALARSSSLPPSGRGATNGSPKFCTFRFQEASAGGKGQASAATPFLPGESFIFRAFGCLCEVTQLPPRLREGVP